MRFWRAWRKRVNCFHHNYSTGKSYIRSQLIDVGRRKMFDCTECGKVWFS